MINFRVAIWLYFVRHSTMKTDTSSLRDATKCICCSTFHGLCHLGCSISEIISETGQRNTENVRHISMLRERFEYAT